MTDSRLAGPSVHESHICDDDCREEPIKWETCLCQYVDEPEGVARVPYAKCPVHGKEAS